MKGFGRDIQGKLKAQRGASLPLALMLFLICALLASVVLTATTAVSGRHAKLAEMDQRYYSVVSAAQLLQNEFEQHPVTIECTQVKKVTTTLSSGEAGAIDRDEEEEVQSVTLSINGKQVVTGKESSTVTDSALTLSELSALHLLLGTWGESVTVNDVWDGSTFDNCQELTVPKTYELSPSVTSAPDGVDKTKLNNALKVNVSEWTSYDGGLQIQLDSVPASAGSTDIYSLTMSLVADIDSDEESEEVVNASTTALVEEKTVTTTRSTTISWTIAELYKTGVTP